MRLSYVCLVASLLATMSLVGLGLAGAPFKEGWLAQLLMAAVLAVLIALFWAGRLHRLVVKLFRHMETSEIEQARAHERDVATGALTRRVFIASCERCLKSLAPATGYALILVDMDHLKQINDAYGHDMGDAALRHLTTVAEQVVPSAILGRVGGDEFALLTECGKPEAARQLAGRFLTELDRTVYHAGRPLNLSASIGIAFAPDDSSFFGELMHFADLALYESKRNGRAQATLFETEMLRDQKQNRFIERELRAAILLNELELAYQPIVDGDGALYACEALVRWRHPARGIIAPMDFIPIAEQSLLIDLLGEWVFRRACLDGLAADPLFVGVNFSASQLKRDDVVSMVERVLFETGMPARRVVIEITESVAMNANENVLRRLRALRALGLRISLDDFGTGYSGFSYLRSFPIDSIKIDRSFVTKLGASEADDVLITALASVANAMGLSIVAEGIETEEQMLLARMAGCKLLQGYHIARPQPWSAIEGMLAGAPPTEAADSAAA